MVGIDWPGMSNDGEVRGSDDSLGLKRRGGRGGYIHQRLQKRQGRERHVRMHTLRRSCLEGRPSQEVKERWQMSGNEHVDGTKECTRWYLTTAAVFSRPVLHGLWKHVYFVCNVMCSRQGPKARDLRPEVWHGWRVATHQMSLSLLIKKRPTGTRREE